MVHLQATCSTTALFTLFLRALADSDLSGDIVGCTDVDCPNDGWDTCTVSDNTFVGVGLTRIAGVPDALSGISIVKGVNISESGVGSSDSNGQDATLPYKSVYFLGTPSDLEVDSLTGCAVVFNDPPSTTFSMGVGENGTNTRAATGTCPDVISQGCIDQLTQQAQNVNYGSSVNACTALQTALTSNPPSECSDLAGAGNGLGNFTVASLSDLSAISQSQNSSSNCWPVLPKSDNLAEFAEDITLGNYTVDGNLAEVYKITPILTVFTGGNNSLVDSTSAQLTCVKVVTTQNIANSTNVGEDAAPLSSHNLMAVGGVALLTVLFTMF